MQPMKGKFQLIIEGDRFLLIGLNNKFLLLPYEQTSFH
jgi:hypothetical protein